MPKADKEVLNGWTLYADIGLPAIRWLSTVCVETGIAKVGTVAAGTVVEIILISVRENRVLSRDLKEKSPLS